MIFASAPALASATAFASTAFRGAVVKRGFRLVPDKASNRTQLAILRNSDELADTIITLDLNAGKQTLRFCVFDWTRMRYFQHPGCRIEKVFFECRVHIKR